MIRRPAEALLRLRARAYSQSRPLHEVAGDVVARRLRFFPDTDAPSAPDNREGWSAWPARCA